MIERRPGQHQTVDQSHRYADIDSLPQTAEHPAGLRPMDYDAISHASVAGGNYERFSVDSKADVTDETFIQNLVDYNSIIAAALRQTL
jgi:hypothetical protein